jgi:hypothetical protein
MSAWKAPGPRAVNSHAVLLRPRQVVDRGAIDVLHHEHLLAAERLVDARDDELVELEPFEQRPEVGHRPHFVEEVQLLGDLLAEADDVGDGVARFAEPLAGDNPEDRVHQVQVGGDDMGDVRPQHLHGDLGPIVQARPVNDGDRGGGHGPVVELAEDLSDRAADAGLDDPADPGPGDGRALVEAAPELVGDRLRDDRWRRGDGLAELHVGRSQALEGPAEGAGEGPMLRAREAAEGVGREFAGECRRRDHRPLRDEAAACVGHRDRLRGERFASERGLDHGATIAPAAGSRIGR